MRNRVSVISNPVSFAGDRKRFAFPTKNNFIVAKVAIQDMAIRAFCKLLLPNLMADRKNATMLRKDSGYF